MRRLDFMPGIKLVKRGLGRSAARLQKSGASQVRRHRFQHASFAVAGEHGADHRRVAAAVFDGSDRHDLFALARAHEPGRDARGRPGRRQRRLGGDDGQVVPVPAAGWLLGSGALWLAARARRGAGPARAVSKSAPGASAGFRRLLATKNIGSAEME